MYLYKKPAVNHQPCRRVSTKVKMKPTHFRRFIFMAAATLQAKHNSSLAVDLASVRETLSMIHAALLGADKPLSPGCRNRGCSCEQTSVRLWLPPTTASVHAVRMVMDLRAQGATACTSSHWASVSVLSHKRRLGFVCAFSMWQRTTFCYENMWVFWTQWAFFGHEPKLPFTASPVNPTWAASLHESWFQKSGLFQWLIPLNVKKSIEV